MQIHSTLTFGMCQTMAQMTMIVTQYLHHVGSYRQFWTEQQMVLISMLPLIHSHWMDCRETIIPVKLRVLCLTSSVTFKTGVLHLPVQV